MQIVLLSGNPKTDGLCYSIEEAIMKGAQEGGAQVQRLTTEEVRRCRICGTGWGICREEHRCVIQDDAFHRMQEIVRQADALCLISPVYWGEMAEGLKSFLDRLRRCEFGQQGAVSGKPVLMVACPGGTGNGLLTCLEQMDRFVRHTGGQFFDYVGVNRWNHDYQREAAYRAAKAMAEGRQPGVTLA